MKHFKDNYRSNKKEKNNWMKKYQVAKNNQKDIAKRLISGRGLK